MNRSALPRPFLPCDRYSKSSLTAKKVNDRTFFDHALIMPVDNTWYITVAVLMTPLAWTHRLLQDAKISDEP